MPAISVIDFLAKDLHNQVLSVFTVYLIVGVEQPNCEDILHFDIFHTFWCVFYGHHNCHSSLYTSYVLLTHHKKYLTYSRRSQHSFSDFESQIGADSQLGVELPHSSSLEVIGAYFQISQSS